MNKSMMFAFGVVWVLVTLLVGLWLASVVVRGNFSDCEKLGRFRFGDRVIECRVLP